jgi:hypothetical protein
MPTIPRPELDVRCNPFMRAKCNYALAVNTAVTTAKSLDNKKRTRYNSCRTTLTTDF